MRTLALLSALALAVLAAPPGVAPGIEHDCPEPDHLRCDAYVKNGNPFMLSHLRDVVAGTPLEGDQLTVGASNGCADAVSTSGTDCELRLCYSPWDVWGCQWVPVPYQVPGLP